MQSIRHYRNSVATCGRLILTGTRNSASQKYFSYVSKNRIDQVTSCRCNCSNGTRWKRAFLTPNDGRIFSATAAFSFYSNTAVPVPSSSQVSGLLSNYNVPFPINEIGTIPEPPSVPSPETIEALQRVMADNLREIGLASYMTPVGLVQNLLDVLHSTTGLPWWEVIVISTLIVRTLTLPVIVVSQRTSALMAQHRPLMDEMNKKMKEAKQSGDTYQMQLAMMEMQEYMKEKHLPGMLRMMVPMALNGVVFMSYFIALRSMATAGLYSMRTEGLLWFTDLTVPDPTLMLPIACALTTLAVIELGIELGQSANAMSPAVRWFMRLIPVSILFFGKMMPAAVLCYWVTSNLTSLALSLAFRIPAVRKKLKIPALPPRANRQWGINLDKLYTVAHAVISPRATFRSIRDRYKKWRAGGKALTADKIRSDDKKRFKAAGEGPVPPTFTFNPKTTYSAAFEKRSLWRSLVRSIRGDDKKNKIKRRASA